MNSQSQIRWLVILPLLLMTLACQSVEQQLPDTEQQPPTATPEQIEGTELPFVTIEQRDWAGYGTEVPPPILKPRLMLVTSADDVDRLEGRVSPEALDELAALDYQQYFVIALFRGRQGSSGYDTVIERVVQRGNKVIVYAQFWAPSPYWEVTGAETSPYHIVKVHRGGEVGEETQLVLRSRPLTPTPPPEIRRLTPRPTPPTPAPPRPTPTPRDALPKDRD